MARREVTQAERALAHAIHESPLCERKTICSARGCQGRARLARTLIVNLPELGTLSRKQIAALVESLPSRVAGRSEANGPVAPRTHVEQHVHGGPWWGPAALPSIRSFYQPLCDAGKAKKVALTACMRKLLTISTP